MYIEPESPWENGYIESFTGKLRDELLNTEIFTTSFEAQVLIENWKQGYHQIRPHSALGYRPPPTWGCYTGLWFNKSNSECGTMIAGRSRVSSIAPA
jgi:hypothetical protein